MSSATMWVRSLSLVWDGLNWKTQQALGECVPEAEVCRFSQVPASLLDSEPFFRIGDGSHLLSLPSGTEDVSVNVGWHCRELIFVPVSATSVCTHTHMVSSGQA